VRHGRESLFCGLAPPFDGASNHATFEPAVEWVLPNHRSAKDLNLVFTLKCRWSNNDAYLGGKLCGTGPINSLHFKIPGWPPVPPSSAPPMIMTVTMRIFLGVALPLLLGSPNPRREPMLIAFSDPSLLPAATLCLRWSMRCSQRSVLSCDIKQSRPLHYNASPCFIQMVCNRLRIPNGGNLDAGCMAVLQRSQSFLSSCNVSPSLFSILPSSTDILTNLIEAMSSQEFTMVRRSPSFHRLSTRTLQTCS